MVDHYNLVIATPASMLHAAYVRSLAKTTKELSRRGISWTFVNYESCYIANARERIMNDSDEDPLLSNAPFSNHFTYDKILWIDSDIEWEPEHALELYYSERDIVSGVYMMTNGRVAVSYDGKLNPYPQQVPASRETQVSTCGFGFLCIKNGVFEKMPRPWFESYIYDDNGRLATILGEDTSWCMKANEAGFSIWLNPNVKVLHHKTMALAWH